eukprot:g12751.t1
MGDPWSWVSSVPVLGAVKAVVHNVAGDHRLAQETWDTHNSASHEAVAYTPGAGHIKALVHRAAGHHREADDSARKATSSWEVAKKAVPAAAAGAAMGTFVAGPAGAVGGAVTMGVVETLTNIEREETALRKKNEAAAVASHVDKEDDDAKLRKLLSEKEKLMKKKKIRQLQEEITKLQAEEDALRADLD